MTSYEKIIIREYLELKNSLEDLFLAMESIEIDLIQAIKTIKSLFNYYETHLQFIDDQKNIDPKNYKDLLELHRNFKIRKED